MTIRGHRPVRQMLLGLVPVLVVGLVLLVVLGLRLGDTRGVLDQATARAVGTVVGTGQGDGRGVDVTFTDADGVARTGRLTLDEDQDAPPLGATVPDLRYDPAAPDLVYADGDATSAAIADELNGLAVVVLILVVVTAVSGVRWLRRRRLERAAPVAVSVRRERWRRGLIERTWLVADTGRGPAWFPVYWDHPVERVGEDPTSVTAHGSPTADALVAFEVGGTVLWPSGRRRESVPRGTQLELPAPEKRATLLRQVRTDAVIMVLAPVLGLLWAYLDGSGPAGFVFATALAAAVLFWVPSVQGSDPT